MVALQEVEAQLKAIGANYRFWGRPEIIELQHILVPGEKIQACLNGRYKGGGATMVGTDRRLLLIDKKLLYLTVEGTRYDMIAEVDFSGQLLSGTMRVISPSKVLSFTSYRPGALRQLARYIQHQVMQMQQQRASQPATTYEALRPSMPAPLQPAVREQSLAEISVPAQTSTLTSSVHPVIAQTFATMLGNQAINGLESTETTINLETSLPGATLRNPYASKPVIRRPRIGRFGSISGNPAV